MFQDLKKYDSLLKGYTELRVQSNTNLAISLVKGNVTNNIKTSVSGVSARTRKNGLWGFASNNRINKEGIERAIKQANENALLLSSSLKGTSKEVEVFNGATRCDMKSIA